MKDRKPIIAVLIVIIASALCCWGVLRYLLGLLPGWLAIVLLVVAIAVFVARRMTTSRFA